MVRYILSERLLLIITNLFNIPGGVLRISSDGDDQRILGLKFLIPRSFSLGAAGPRITYDVAINKV